MKKKHSFYCELAYVAGLLLLPLGVSFMEKADLGISMVVAPAYLIYRKLSIVWPFFTFGMAEYTLQLVILLLLILILRKFRLYFLFSFVTAFLYGLVLDGYMLLLPTPDAGAYLLRVFFFVFGSLLCCLGVSLFFHTYISPEVYELFVKEVCAKWGFNISRTKTVYDCCSCLIGIILSFSFFGLWHFEGIKLGTLLCAILNGKIIGLFSAGLEKIFVFKDRYPLRKYFG